LSSPRYFCWYLELASNASDPAVNISTSTMMLGPSALWISAASTPRTARRPNARYASPTHTVRPTERAPPSPDSSPPPSASRAPTSPPRPTSRSLTGTPGANCRPRVPCTTSGGSISAPHPSITRIPRHACISPTESTSPNPVHWALCPSSTPPTSNPNEESIPATPNRPSTSSNPSVYPPSNSRTDLCMNTPSITPPPRHFSTSPATYCRARADMPPPR